ncbi:MULTISPECIES: STAS domain-containing protein [Micromonospora]|uniref:STAS domain-containing protein n=1 Tax=Micromonospora aurantiaca (nom. illeg.) TaxID=47850 RepID=A0ABQ6UKM2_9ACTN|nr:MULTISPECIES: STAS domain-containing protein [Micromonospora]KAB1116883.1 STAS domain-containing protein [Micromonospora aurantiaca]UFN95149.1 STAS domain-containing protein [Micromonospora aurantiaca]
MSDERPVFGCHDVPTASGAFRRDEPIMWLSCDAGVDMTWISVAGEVDLSNAHLLTELVESAVAAPAPLVVIDLSEVSFFGAYGTNALVLAQRVLTGHGRRLVLHRPSPVVRRVLGVTGTLTAFEVVDRPALPAADDGSARPVVPTRSGS